MFGALVRLFWLREEQLPVFAAQSLLEDEFDPRDEVKERVLQLALRCGDRQVLDRGPDGVESFSSSVKWT